MYLSSVIIAGGLLHLLQFSFSIRTHLDSRRRNLSSNSSYLSIQWWHLFSISMIFFRLTDWSCSSTISFCVDIFGAPHSFISYERLKKKMSHLMDFVMRNCFWAISIIPAVILIRFYLNHQSKFGVWFLNSALHNFSSNQNYSSLSKHHNLLKLKLVDV